MARLIYEITGDISGLESAINSASNLIKGAGAQSSQLKINIPDISPQIKAGVAALDQLDKKLSVITGNASLFGDSVKLQAQEVAAYQTAISSLLANGFSPMDGDVQRLKQHLDELSASFRNVKNAEAVVATSSKETFEEVQAFLNATRNAQGAQGPVISAAPSVSVNGLGQTSALTALNQQLIKGTITVLEYNAALAEAGLSMHAISESAVGASAAIETEVGVIQGLKEQLASLNAQRIVAPQEDLAAINAKIQQTELSLQQAANIGKVGFDQMGNAIKGVSVQNINGQLLTLSNNLFGARQISKDLVRTFDSTSVSTFARSIGLLAVDFLFFAQNAQFAKTSTVGATAAIAVEGEVAATSSLSTGALGAAFASLLTPTSLIVLGIAAAGAAFIAFEGAQKKALDVTKDFTKEISKDAGTELGPLVSLYGATQNVTLSIQNRIAAAQQLRETYPAEFANATNLSIVNGQLKSSYDSLTQSIIANAKAEAAKSEIQKVESEIIKNQLIIDQNNLDKASRIKAVKPLSSDEIASQNRSGGGAVTVADQIKAITNEINFANKGAATKIVELNSTVKSLVGFITNVNKAATDLQKANALLGPNLQNFTNLLTLGSSKQDFENIKNALQTELNALAPSDPQIDTLRAKILQVEEIIKNAYDVKITKGAKTDPFAAIANSITDIFNKINAKSSESGLTGYQLAVQKIKDTYTQINAELDKQQQKLTALQKVELTPAKQDIKDNLQVKLDDTRVIADAAKNKELKDAQIKEAQRVSDEIQRINDEFGVKAEVSRGRELAQIQKMYDAEVVKAQGNKDILDALNADRLVAVRAIDEKYIQQELQTYDKIAEIANSAFQILATGETSRTDKLNIESQKRITAANAEFNKLRDLAKGLPQASLDQINSIQAQVNLVIKDANIKQVSEEISKNFASAMQSAVQGFVSNFYTSLTTLGQARQTIDDKYNQQLQQQQTDYANSVAAGDGKITAAQNDVAINQINNLKKLEQSSTTSFGAIFSSLVSKFNSTFNQSILNSFTKQFTENLGKTLLTPTAKQLAVSPEELAAQKVAADLKTAGSDLATQIKQAGIDFAAKVKGANIAGVANTPGGVLAQNTAFGGGSSIGQSISLAGTSFGTSTANAGAQLSGSIIGSSISAASTTTSAASAAGTSIENAGSGLSSKVAGAASALSLAGSLISGATSPTSSVGQGIGGVLSGAGTGALIGSVFGPEGTVAGAVIGGVIGGISGLFSASKAKKQEELQAAQLKQQQITNDLLARQAALAYTTSIVGRMTQQGIVTGVDLNAFGQLTATVSGKSILFVLDRVNNGR